MGGSRGPTEMPQHRSVPRKLQMRDNSQSRGAVGGGGRLTILILAKTLAKK